MKKIIIYSLLAFGLLSNLNAYELNGPLEVKWTGFKTEKKVGVSGTFKDISLDIKKSDDFVEFLKSAKVEIQTLSFDSKNTFRDKNITSTLFSLATATKIEGYLENINTASKKMTLQVTMNKVKHAVPMTFKVKDGMIIAKGKIDILDYDMDEPFAAFALKCAHYHENKSFSDVDIEFTIPYK